MGWCRPSCGDSRTLDLRKRVPARCARRYAARAIPASLRSRGDRLRHGLASLRQRFLVDERAPLPVVQVALLLGQPVRVAFDEAALEKPARCARREDEQPRELELLRPLLDFVQECLAISFTPEIGMHG